MTVIEVKCTKCGYEFFTRELKSSIGTDNKYHVECICANDICSNNDCIIIRTTR